MDLCDSPIFKCLYLEITSVELRDASADNIYPLDSSRGEHFGTSENPLLAWDGEMILWETPNAYDATYVVTFNKITMVDLLTVTYDAGATVLAKTVDGSDELGSAECYESNGGKTNQCNVRIGSEIDGLQVVIDSHHTVWNWMGNFSLWDHEGNIIPVIWTGNINLKS